MKNMTLLLATIICLVFNTQAFSNSSIANGEVTFAPERIKQFSKNMEQALANEQALVAIIARVGRPDLEMPKGLKYTHIGFAVYSTIELADGKSQAGYVMYNLYQKADQLNKSELVRDFPFDFYSAVYQLRSGIIIPKPALQKKILNVLNSKTYLDLHNPNYSAISNPFNLKFQNCTEHTLDVIQAALYNTSDKRQIKANLEEHFKPYVVPFNGLKVMLGAFLSHDVAATDHAHGRFETATYGSIKNYFEQYNLAQAIFELEGI